VAKVKPTKLQAFFEGRRRKAVLLSWAHLKTRAGESRVKLDLKIPLLNEDVLGMPEAISQAFGVMAADDSRVERTNLNIFYAGMTLEAFTADTGKTPAVSCTGVMVHKFSLVAQGDGEKREVNLHAVAYVPANMLIRDWAWEHLHGGFFLEMVYSQTEIEFEPEVEPEEEEEDEEPAEGEPAEPLSKEEELELAESGASDKW